MRKYILSLDSIGKSTIELATILDNPDIKVINSSDIKNAIIKSNELGENLKLVIWNAYSEENFIFEDIIKFKKIKKFSRIPIIVISNVSKNEFVIRAIKSGATDFIIRPYNKLFLKSKIENLLCLDSKISYVNLSEIKEKVDFSIKELLSIYIKGANRGKYKISAVMMSLEKSKDLNIQQQEHAIDIIQKVFTKNARETDLIIKYNKSNLLMILPYTDENGIKVFNNKIINLIMESAVLKRESAGAIISSSYDTLSYDYIDNIEDVIIKKLQSKLKVCAAISNK